MAEGEQFLKQKDASSGLRFRGFSGFRVSGVWGLAGLGFRVEGV